MNKTDARSRSEVIVVGGGFAGLATGALLAHAGAHVRVLERRPILGGRALVVKQEGFTLNYGLHYIVGGYRSPHHRILKHIDKLKTAPLMPVKPRLLHRMRDGQLYQVPSTPTDMLSTKLLSVRGKLSLPQAMLKIVTAKDEKLWRVPVGEWLDGVTREPTLRAFFLDLVGPLTFEAEAEALSAAHFAQVMRPFLMPKGPIALYPAGGWISMFDAFKQHIEERGGSVELKTPAERLEIDGGNVRGVWVNSELQHADHVVLALPPNELNELLKDTPISGLETERLQAIRPTMGVAIDLGVMGLENNHIGTIELPELNGTLGIHNLFEPSLAPAGGHLFQFLRFMTPAQMQDKADVEQTEPLLLQVLEGIWPAFRDKVVMRRTLVRNVLTAATHRYDQPRPTLLPVKVDAVEGLYLAGDATASAGELSNSAGESAIAAAGFIANRAGLGAISL